MLKSLADVKKNYAEQHYKLNGSRRRGNISPKYFSHEYDSLINLIESRPRQIIRHDEGTWS